MRIPHSVVGRTQPSQQSLDYFRVSSPDMSPIGRGLGMLGASLEKLKEEQERQDKFNQQTLLVNENTETLFDMHKRMQSEPLGADDFARRTLADYEERHDQLLGKMRNDGYSEEIVRDTEVRLAGLRQNLVEQGLRFQVQSSQARSAVQMGEASANLARAVSLDPYEIDGAIEQHNDLIDSVPGIDEIQRAKLKEEGERSIRLAAGMAMSMGEPSEVVRLLRPSYSVGDGREIAGVQDAGKGYTTVTYSDGTTERRSGTRATRNNNPGNIVYGSFAQRLGAVGSDGRFAVFPSYETGRAAKEHLLFNTNAYRTKTIRGAIERYAPPNENDTNAYVREVAASIGVSPSTKMEDLTPGQRQVMLDAMERVEGFERAQPAETPEIQVIDSTAGKIRSQAVAPQVMEQAKRAVAATDPTLAIKVVSGGQPGKGMAALTGASRTGSTRHDDGNAMDIVLVRNGKPVTPASDPELYEEFLENAAAAGFTGIGHYAWGVHVGGGSVAAWGPDTTSATLDPRFEAAINRGRAKGSTNLVSAAAGSVNHPVLDKLTYDERLRVLSAAQTEMNRRNADVRAQLDLDERNASTAYLAGEDYEGTIPTLDRYIDVYGSIGGQQKWQEFQNVKRQGELMQDMRTMPESSIEERLASMRPADTSSPTYAVDMAAWSQAGEAAARVRELRSSDPAGYVMRNYPAVQQAWDQVAQGEGDRARAYALMQEAYRQLEIPPWKRMPMPNAAIEAEKQAMASSTPEQKIARLAGWQRDMGELYPLGLEQLGKAGLGMEAYLSNLVTSHPPAAQTAANVLRGQTILEADPSRAPPRTGINGTEQAAFELLGNAETMLAGEVSKAIKDSAIALYVANGGPREDVDPTLFEAALREVLGGDPANSDTGWTDMRGYFSAVNDNTILPPGVTGDEMRDWLDTISDTDLAAVAVDGEMPWGEGFRPMQISAEDIARDGVLVQVAPGQYVVKMNSDGRPLITQEGEWFRLRLDAETIHAVTRPVDGSPLIIDVPRPAEEFPEVDPLLQISP